MNTDEIVECLKRNRYYSFHEVKNDKHTVINLCYKGERAVISVFFCNDGSTSFTPHPPDLPLSLSFCNALYTHFNQVRKKGTAYLYEPKVDITLT